MRYETTGFEQKSSRFGGIFYYLFLKREDGKSFRTCLDPRMRNYQNWRPVLEQVKNGVMVELEGLNEIKGDMIDADSRFRTLAYITEGGRYGAEN